MSNHLFTNYNLKTEEGRIQLQQDYNLGNIKKEDITLNLIEEDFDLEKIETYFNILDLTSNLESQFLYVPDKVPNSAGVMQDVTLNPITLDIPVYARNDAGDIIYNTIREPSTGMDIKRAVTSKISTVIVPYLQHGRAGVIPDTQSITSESRSRSKTFNMAVEGVDYDRSKLSNPTSLTVDFRSKQNFRFHPSYFCNGGQARIGTQFPNTNGMPLNTYSTALNPKQMLEFVKVRISDKEDTSLASYKQFLVQYDRQTNYLRITPAQYEDMITNQRNVRNSSNWRSSSTKSIQIDNELSILHRKMENGDIAAEADLEEFRAYLKLKNSGQLENSKKEIANKAEPIKETIVKKTVVKRKSKPKGRKPKIQKKTIENVESGK
jgi:hypothetical protein